MALLPRASLQGKGAARKVCCRLREGAPTPAERRCDPRLARRGLSRAGKIGCRTTAVRSGAPPGSQFSGGAFRCRSRGACEKRISSCGNPPREGARTRAASDGHALSARHGLSRPGRAAESGNAACAKGHHRTAPDRSVDARVRRAARERGGVQRSWWSGVGKRKLVGSSRGFPQRPRTQT